MWVGGHLNEGLGQDVVAGDVDGDGDAELIAAAPGDVGQAIYGAVYVVPPR
jgi:hypothetical protein